MAEQLTALTTIFFLSLLGSVVLFKFLKSSAIIERKEHRVGGALAGFLLTLSSLGVTYAQIAPEPPAPVEEWMIVGEFYNGEQPQPGATVEIMPPHSYLTGQDGRFFLDGVPVVDGELPYLSAEIDGRGGQLLQITDDTAEIDRKEKLIRLKEPWKLVAPRETADAAGGDEATGLFLETPADGGSGEPPLTRNGG